MSACQHCGGTEIEYDSAQGNSFCVACGAVLEENTIVAEVTFLDAANGAAVASGGFVSEETQGRTAKAGAYGKFGRTSSREQTVANARRIIQRMAHALKLNEHHVEAAQRYYNLALINNFVKGRKSVNVAAACLYIVCRQQKTSHMLIDFSDVLSTSVFALGNTFLKLVKELNLKLPMIDPSLYISRFAAMLEFGNKTHVVANDALRLVQRMSRDWIHTGRRPAGICGACLLIAARMHNFKRTIKEVVHVVKMAEITIRKRLLEFKETPSATLSIEDFQTVWLESTHDPPAFKRNRQKEILDKMANGEDIKDLKDELLALEEEEDEDEDEEPSPTNEKGPSPDTRKRKRQESKGDADPTEVVPGDAEEDNEMDPNSRTEEQLEKQVVSLLENQELQAVEKELFRNKSVSVSRSKFNPTITPEDQRLSDLDDDDELSNVILTSEEAELKSKIWHELNRDYLLEQQFKAQQPAKKPGKPRAKKQKTSQPAQPAASAAEAVKQSLARKLSKKINYSALEKIFDPTPDSPNLGHRRERSSTPAFDRRYRESSVSSYAGSMSGRAGSVGLSTTGSTKRLGGVSSLFTNSRSRGSTPDVSVSTQRSTQPISVDKGEELMVEDEEEENVATEQTGETDFKKLMSGFRKQLYQGNDDDGEELVHDLEDHDGDEYYD